MAVYDVLKSHNNKSQRVNKVRLDKGQARRVQCNRTLCNWMFADRNLRLASEGQHTIAEMLVFVNDAKCCGAMETNGNELAETS